MSVVILDALGMIHDVVESPEDLEARELEEALALSLSLTTLEPTVIHPSPKAGPPPPPSSLVRPPPPDVEPSERARQLARIPTLFPPVGHAWNSSRHARWAQRPRRPRRHRRCRFAVPESFAYFPPNGSGYERLRPRRHLPPISEPDSHTETDESRDDASSTQSTAPSHFDFERYNFR